MKRHIYQRLARAAAMAALACAAIASAQEAAIVKRATELRESPSETSPSVAPLAKDAPLSRTNERQGAWVKVRTPQGQTGWLHMFDVGASTGASANAGSGNSVSSGMRGLGGLFGGSAGASTTTATSTAGIRGLGAEDIANAQPNPSAVTQAEGLRASADQARQFATSSALKAREVPALAQPARPTSGSTSTSGSGNPSDPNFSPN